MNYRNILFMISMLLLVIGIAMGSAILVGLFYKNSNEVLKGLTLCTALTLFTSLACVLLSTHRNRKEQDGGATREGFIAVSLSWMAAILFGALPFIICAKFQIADAIFETASGVTTTGASIIDGTLRLRTGEILTGGLESLPQCIHYWRCLLNWLGGIGFVMFILMLLPILGGGRQLYNAEVPGLKTFGDQLTPRMATTSALMMACYVAWTALVVIGYRCLGMPNWFEAVVHAFSTVSTGGFSPHSASFGFFRQPQLQWASTIFMLVSSFNLMLLLKLMFQGRFEFHKDEELRWFFCAFAGVSILFAFQLIRQGIPVMLTNGEALSTKWEPMLRTTSFQAVSLMSTTGYATSDFTLWNLPGLPAIVLVLMFLGGCGGSTSGGLKFIRLLVLFKQSLLELKRRIFPHLVPNVHVGELPIEQSVVQQTMAFLFLYVATIGLCTIALPYICPMGFETAFSSAVTAVSNVGPGLGKISPSFTFSWMNPGAKYILAFAMVAGRLELYTVFILFLPSFWKTKQIFTRR